MQDILLLRFERYFRHSAPSHEVLSLGDSSFACANIRRALDMLHVTVAPSSQPQSFDQDLEAAVKHFQEISKHRVADGRVGPGTRELITTKLLIHFDPTIFLRFERPEADQAPTVFLSYAWSDRAKVNQLDQWLRDKGIYVIRDESFFQAGTTIPDNIRRAISRADKVLAVFSVNSRDRDWPRFEREITEELEAKIHQPVLIYLCLDDIPLPAHDSSRLAILAANQPLKDVGAAILHTLTGIGLQPKRYSYNENEPL